MSLSEAAHRLAMLALQSDRYQRDPDYRDATDDVLAWTKPQRPSERAAPREEE